MASVLTPHTMLGVTPAITSGLPALPMPTIRGLHSFTFQLNLVSDTKYIPDTP